MPMDKSHYPADWKSISLRIRARENNRCKVCGVANGAVGARDVRGEWHDESAIHPMNSSDQRCCSCAWDIPAAPDANQAAT